MECSESKTINNDNYEVMREQKHLSKHNTIQYNTEKA
jgi:hypothetical protein